MSNQVYRTDTFDTWRVKTNDTSKVLGELATLDSRITLTTLVFKGATANSFSVGNTVTGAVSGATATVDSIVSNILTVLPTNANTFVGADVAKSKIYLSGAGDLTPGSTITGATSGVTAKVFSYNAVENSAVIYNRSGIFTPAGEALTGGSKAVTAASYDTIVDLGESISNGTNSRELETASKTAISSINELQRDVGTVASLATAEKTNLVGALNEIKDSAITFNGAKTFSENLNLTSTKVFTINGASVLSATTLGNGVVNSSLQTVGTISTGTWQGTIVSPTYGGTGINNGSRTITLNTGNLTLTAQSGGSSVTVPTTGTLATLAGSETLTNKTITLGTNTITGTLSQFNTALTDDDFAALAASQTLTNKTITLGTNTITGTLSQFNTALTDDDFAALSATQTLNNKSLVDSTTFIIDETDSTKKLQFQVSGITTNTTRTLTVPNFDGTIATLAGSETLTNKTITLGSNTITGTLAQFNTSLTDDDFAALSAIQTLTNKTITLGSNTITGTLAQFNTALTDDDFAALAATQTLTNKTITLGSNTITGTLSQFNTALTDDDFAALAANQTLTNKTIALGSNSISGTLAQFNTALTDDDFVAITTPQTLTNKSLQDSTTFIIDDVSATKRARFEASGITAGQTRIQTFQDRDGTLAHTDNTTFIGTTSVPLVRSTGNLALTGISSVTLPGATSGTILLQPAAAAGTNTITLPATTGTVVTTGDNGTVTSTMIADGTIVNADINAAAAIAYSKLNLAASIVNADIATGAAIANSKIAGLAASATTDTTNATNISSGTLADARIAGALTGKTYNGLTITSTTGTLTVAAAKTLSVQNTLTLSGTDGSTLNIGAGGTLGSAAYTAAGAYSPLAGSTSLVTLGTVTTGTWNATSISTAYTDAKITAVTGTANQVLVNGVTAAQTGALTLTLPQNIHTGATPTFSGLTVSRNQATGSPVVVFSISNPAYVSPAVAERFSIKSDGSVVIEGNLSVTGQAAFTSTTYTPAWSTITGKPAPTYTVTLTGDVTGTANSGAVTVGDNASISVAATLPNMSGLIAGPYTKVTVNTKGLVTAGTTLSASDIPALAYLSNATNSTQNGYFNDVFLWDTANPSHYLGINNSSDLTAARALNINVNDADRTISLSGNLTVSAAATVSGTNTGDQTITLTGDVTGTGTGSFATSIAAGAVVEAKIGTGAVTSTKIGDGAVIEAKIGTGAVTTIKIADLNVTTVKIADGNVTNAKLASGIDIGKLTASTFSVTGSSGLSAGGSASLGGTVSLTNTDRGSSQNIFKNIAVAGQNTVVADSNDDTVTLATDGSLVITTNATTDTITIVHADTSSVGNLSSDNSNGVVLQDIAFTYDTYGHVLTSAVATTDLDSRYVRLSNTAQQTIGTGDVVFSGNVSVSGNLTINGTTTTVNSTTATVKDPIITLGGADAGAAVATDDNKDRGVEFRWHTGAAAKTGFFGYDDSTGYFTFIPDATNTSEVFSGTQGDIQAANFRGALIGNATTASTWQTARTLTIGNTGKPVDGSANVTWTLGEIGAIGPNGNTTGQAGYVANALTIGAGLSGTVSTYNGSAAVTISHSDTSSAADLAASSRRYVTGLTFDTYGHVTGYTTGTETVTDTTYTLDGSGTANSVNIELIAGGSGSGTDSINVVGSGATTVAWDEGNQRVTISSVNTTYTNGTGLALNGTTFSLPASGVTANTYNNVTVNDRGIVTGGSNVAYLTSYTETDTLGSVVNRGSTTTLGISVGTSNGGGIGIGSAQARSYITQNPSLGLTIKAYTAGSMYAFFMEGTLGNQMIRQDLDGRLVINGDGYTTNFGGPITCGAITSSSTFTAGSFVKSGGTSGQFLKADGSVDSTTYLTSATGVSAINVGLITGGGTGFTSVGSLVGGVNWQFSNPLTGTVTNPNAIDVSLMTQAGLTAGTYNNVTVSNKGIVTAASNVAYLSGTVAVANGGTGATTLTGYVKGNGTSAFTASSTVPWSDVSNRPLVVKAASISSQSVTGGANLNLTSTFDNNGTEGSNVYTVKVSSGTGITIAQSGGNEISVTNAGVTSISGTTNQVTVSASTGSVTVSLPQNIHTGATVQFDRLGIGSGGSPDVMSGLASGEIRARDNITAYYASDERLKTNIKKIDNALEKVSQIDGVIYDWNEQYKNDHGGVDGYFIRNENSGVIAQQVEKVFPNVVADRSNGFKAVRYELLVPLLIEAIKDLKAEIEALKAQK